MTRNNTLNARTLGTALGLTLAASALAAEPGFKTHTLEVAHRDRALEVHLWYPTASDAEPMMLGKNVIFNGAPVIAGATPLAGAHPMIVLSHGSGGNAPNLSWIAGALAERGFVVAATNHPHTTSRDSIQTETVKVWERPADLSAMIDAALAGAYAGLEIDAQAIGALGFSLGGHSVLSLSGANTSQQAYTTYCNDYADMLDCTWLRAGGVVFEELDDPRFEQSNHDPRISAVVAVDPALSQAYVRASMEAMNLPVKLINLGTGADVPTVVNATKIAGQIPDAELVEIEDASHFSFLGTCTWKSTAILMVAGEDPICKDPGPRARSDIHQELQSSIGSFFERSLRPATPQG